MIHCGACMLSEREVQSRYRDFLDKGIPICNYGLAMAKMNGILDRAVENAVGKGEQSKERKGLFMVRLIHTAGFTFGYYFFFALFQRRGGREETGTAPGME